VFDLGQLMEKKFIKFVKFVKFVK